MHAKTINKRIEMFMRATNAKEFDSYEYGRWIMLMVDRASTFPESEAGVVSFGPTEYSDYDQPHITDHAKFDKWLEKQMEGYQ